MKTVKMYENNAYLRSCEAVITAVSDEHPSDSCSEHLYTVCFDRTVFFPEGGGQSADTGRAYYPGDPEHAFRVTDVQEKDGLVYHVLKADGGIIPPKPGDAMALEIDWDHRFDNMQRHLGEHILSGAFYRLFGAVNKGFHMGGDYITIDLAFDREAQDRMGLSRFDRVTWEMAEKAELEANRVIWLDAPVTRSHFDTREEAEKLPLRKALAFDEDISVITVGNPTSPYDCVACCGTHPSSAGQVGMIKIYKIEPNKGMSRIYLECGERAFRHYQTRLNDMYDVSCELSTGLEDLKKKFYISEEKTAKLHDRLTMMSQRVVRSEALSIMTCGDKTVSRVYDDLTTDDLLQIVRQMDRLSREYERPELTILAGKSENTALLVSDARDCGKLVKENAPAFSGKGGGKSQMARAMFGSSDDLLGFVDILSKQD